MKRLAAMFAALAAVAFASAARAEDASAVAAADPPAAAPLAPDLHAEAPSPKRWTLDLGVAVRERPAHIAANSYSTDVWPVIELQYGTRLHVSLDDGIKWSAVKVGPIAFGPIAEYRTAYNDRLPPRTDKLSDAVELGGFIAATTAIGVVEARVRHAVTGYGGDSADLAFDTGGALTKRLAWTVEARTSWVDREYLRHFVGRRRGTPLPAPQEHVQDYDTTGAQVGLSYALSSRTSFSAFASEDRLLSHVPKSFAGSRNLLGLSLVLTHRWGGHTF